MPYLNDMGILCALGCSAQEVRQALVTRDVAVPAPENYAGVLWRTVGAC